MTTIPAAISSGTAAKGTPQSVGNGGSTTLPKQQDELKKAFQTFVAGTFYKQMFKSLRKMSSRPAYFYGGKAEEMFRSQMDQEVAENLAKRPDDALSSSLYHAYAQQLRLKRQSGS